MVRSDHADAAEVDQVIRSKGRVAVIIVVQRCSDRRGAIATSGNRCRRGQGQRYDEVCTIAAFDQCIGDAGPAETGAKAGDVCGKGKAGERIRTCGEAHRARREVGVGRRRAISKVLVVECQGQRITSRRTCAIGDGDWLHSFRNIAIGIGDAIAERCVDARSVILVVSRIECPASVGLEGVNTFGRRELVSTRNQRAAGDSHKAAAQVHMCYDGTIGTLRIICQHIPINGANCILGNSAGGFGKG